MKGSKLIDIFKEGNIVIPMYFLKNYKRLKIEMNDFVFLMYLYNYGNNCIFDPIKFSSELNCDITEIMNLVSNLTDKGLMKVEVSKNDKGYSEELINLDGFFNKVGLFAIDDINKENDKEKESDNTFIFEFIEKEFGRTLSPTESEIIKAWIDNDYSEELIKEAVKEAVFNGVSKLRYIDKILYEWSRKGIKTVKDVEENRKKRNSMKEENDSKVDLGVLEWKWFDDDE